MINISERPAAVADRAVPGDWEGEGDPSSPLLERYRYAGERYPQLISVDRRVHLSLSVRWCGNQRTLPNGRRSGKTGNHEAG
jgi:hypothetical protein